MKTFKKPAPTQQAIIALLRASPLPWHADMIAPYIERTPDSTTHVLHLMVGAQRVARVCAGWYTVPERVPRPWRPKKGVEFLGADFA